MQLGTALVFCASRWRFHGLIWLTALISFPLMGQNGIVIQGNTGVERDELEAPRPIQDVWSVEAARMQAHGDSLFLNGKSLAALGMYHAVEKRTYQPCQLALSYRGIAQVHAQKMNVEEARAAVEMAETYLPTCNDDMRLQLVLDLAEVHLHLGQDQAAEELVQNELKLHPEHPELRALLVRIVIIQGDWYAAGEAVEAMYETIERDGVTEQNWAWLHTMQAQSHIKNHLAFPDSIQREFLVAIAPLPREQRTKHREAILRLLQSESVLAFEALEWAKAMRDEIPRNAYDEYTVASLEVAKCAMRAAAPSLAMLSYHDAMTAAERSNNKWLLAEALRQSAEFQVHQRDHQAALASYRQLDSVNMAIARAYADVNNRPVKHFRQHTLEQPDLFDQALLHEHASAPDYGAWPWVVALLVLGLLTLSLHNREMRKSLRTERNRIIRLRALIPVGKMAHQEQPHTRVGGMEAAGEAHWAFHPGLADENHPEYQSIATFLKQLDAELAYPITWDVPGHVNLVVNEDVQSTLRTLLRQFKEWGEGISPIDVKVEQNELEWKFSVTSDHTHTSREMSSLFAGKDVQKSGWKGLYGQLQKLAARVVVERLNGKRERLTITLPLGHL